MTGGIQEASCPQCGHKPAYSEFQPRTFEEELVCTLCNHCSWTRSLIDRKRSAADPEGRLFLLGRKDGGLVQRFLSSRVAGSFCLRSPQRCSSPHALREPLNPRSIRKASSPSRRAGWPSDSSIPTAAPKRSGTTKTGWSNWSPADFHRRSHRPEGVGAGRSHARHGLMSQMGVIDVGEKETYDVTNERHDEVGVQAMAVTVKDQLERKQAAQVIHDAKSLVGLSVSDLADMWGIHRRTLLRYSKGDTTPQQDVRKSLDELRELTYLLRKVFPKEKAATTWLYTPEELLRGRRPIDLVVRGQTDKVIHVLGAMHSGAFV